MKIDEDGWKWIRMDKMDENGWKWTNVDENIRIFTCISDAILYLKFIFISDLGIQTIVSLLMQLL